MAISFNSDINSVMNNLNLSKTSSTKAASLESTLGNLGNLEEASDEDLMQACKSFEAYLVERVMAKTKEAIIPSDENENQYLTLFKDKLYEEYANQIVENGELGIAQQLYEAMRRDYGRPSIK
ncbi:MAG: rod-binding protein [Lachnospiraceae bacterium]|nr:rod-binding protein [Lachnospiraceae bacterium]